MNKIKFFPTQARLDEDAFEAIFFDHYQKVYAALFRLTGDRFEADDLAAETFWRLWERPPAQNENIPGWLFRVATRLGYNALRANRRRARYELGAGQSDWERSSDNNPAQAAEQHLERDHVRQVLREMPLRDVQVLILCHSGLSYKEIAAVIGSSPGSIGTLLSRAEARFEACYRRKL